MGATVGDGKDFSVEIGSDEKGKTVDFDRDKIASGNVIRFKDCDPFFLRDSRITGVRF